MASVPPFLIFFVGALLVSQAPLRARPILLLAIPFLGGLNLYFLPEGSLAVDGLFDYTLVLVQNDRLATLFGIVFHIAAFFGFLFALNLRDLGQQCAGIVYAGSALGAVFAGDLITLFLFWELLAISSVFLILARRTEQARRAAMRYIVIQVLSGVILLAGTLVHLHEGGSLQVGLIGLGGLGSWLIFLAFGIKAAFPLLHTWLTDAYPEATPTGTVLLSSFTTKVAIYALARCFPGTELLIYIGAVMTMFPIFYAVIENDLRRVLSYSLINQLGFMVCGIGLGTELAINGAVSHAFSHIIYKGLLFMSMGTVLLETGKINGSELGGLYKTMPKTTGLCIVGAASISAFPLFSGFVSKSMILVAALEADENLVWFALLFASAGVFHHSGIKIPYFAFFAHDSGIRAKDPPFNMLLAMFIAAALCILIGVFPHVLYGLLPYPVDYVPYTASHVLTQCQLLFYSALAFTWLKLTGLYPPELPSVNLDVDWIYRRLFPAMAGLVLGFFASLDRYVRRYTLLKVGRFLEALFQHHGPQSVLARTWETGSTALTLILIFAVVLFAAYL